MPKFPIEAPTSKPVMHKPRTERSGHGYVGIYKVGVMLKIDLTCSMRGMLVGEEVVHTRRQHVGWRR